MVLGRAGGRHARPCCSTSESARAHFKRLPIDLGLEEINTFQHGLTRQDVSFSAFNQCVAALRFFYGKVLKVPWSFEQIPYQKRIRRVPQVLSGEEIPARSARKSTASHVVRLPPQPTPPPGPFYEVML